MTRKSFILGAGMTGLAAGWASGLDLFEAEEAPGGICSSYYGLRNGALLAAPPADGEAYRFEVGGGHWVFGGDSAVLRFLRSLAPVRTYERRSSVFFSKQDLSVPFPLQNHLRCLPAEIAAQALAEMLASDKRSAATMAEWIEQNFGPTLTQLFFGPFHELYTAGLWTRIAPQDAYKSPVNLAQVIAGASHATAPVGYNTTFVYPVAGLNTLAQQMATRSEVHYGKRAMQIDFERKTVAFADGSRSTYDFLISTLPLNKMMDLAGSAVGEEPDPYTSVLVVNVGAVRGRRCPPDHWLYVADSKSGFHRVGFYSNVDSSFLPQSCREQRTRVSIYVEFAYCGGEKPSADEIRRSSEAAIQELREWEFIAEVEVVHPTWIDVAYTWSRPGSRWRTKALEFLEQNDVIMVGRYARWIFQGIADSIRDGLFVGAAVR